MAAAESPALVKALIEGGADIDAQESSDKWTALHYAAILGNVGSVKVLLDAGAKTNLVEAGGHTAQQFAEGQDHEVAARFLQRASITENS